MRHVALHNQRLARRQAHLVDRPRSAGGGEGRPLRIAMVAPPWIPVPPPAYGGIEAVVDLLVRALEERGHRVTLFAPPGSRARRLISPLGEAHPDKIGSALYEADHVARTFAAIEAADPPFDVVHDHSGFTAVAMADRLPLPVVHTLHGPLDGELAEFYAVHGNKVVPVAISHAQLESAKVLLERAAVVHNPIDLDGWPFRERKEDYLLFIGRMDPVKGADRAIAAAQASGSKLIIAGPVQPGQEEYFNVRVRPHIDGERIRYVGEVGGVVKQELFARARALLMPIRWQEPFGMVMVEALATGTPVIAFPEGAASEIVIDGENGFLVADEREMAQAVTRLGRLDPRRCRQSVRRFSAAEAARRYEQVYREAIALPPRRIEAVRPTAVRA